MPVIPAFRLAGSADRCPASDSLKDTCFRLRPIRAADFLESLLTASNNLGSLALRWHRRCHSDPGREKLPASLCASPTTSCRLPARAFSKPTTSPARAAGAPCSISKRTTQKIRAATGHLKGVRIAIMGCIVNGPGEMADADFGYVGGAPGKINLYVGKDAVKFNIPEAEAVDRLIDLIREHGSWVDAPVLVENADTV